LHRADISPFGIGIMRHVDRVIAFAFHWPPNCRCVPCDVPLRHLKAARYAALSRLLLLLRANVISI
jgi:hypothetical protein